MPQRPNRRLADGLLALGSAAVIAVYAVGYVQTEPAAASANAASSATPPAIVTSPTTNATALPSPTLVPAVPPTATNRAVNQPTVPPTTPTASISAATTLRDGSYTGTGSSRHGGIEATVVVQGGRIVSAEITNCGTRYPCSKIATLPGQVVARQSGSVDMISRATDSSVAYRSAVLAALAKAR